MRSAWGRVSLAIAAALTAAVSVRAHAGSPADSARLARIVLSQFAAWDRDGDGTLSPAEIEVQVADPANTGEVAAAAAALHGRITLKKVGPIGDLNAERFRTMERGELPLPPESAADDDEASQDERDTETDLGKRFAQALARLRDTKRDLWTKDGPAFADVRQGRLGDCYVLAPLGALVHRNPADVRAMIVPIEGESEKAGWFRVTFADGRVEEVPPFTDGEWALGGASTRRGIWVRVLEKAYGARRIPDEEMGRRIARDETMGGSVSTAGAALTGHAFDRVRLIGDFSKEVTPEDIEAKRKAVLDKAPAALSAKRLVLASTADHAQPKSISPNHAYAILSIDEAAGTIEIWNPHGSNFTLKGEAGLKNGYARKGGVFTMPLDDFVRTFASMSIETDRKPAPKKP